MDLLAIQAQLLTIGGQELNITGITTPRKRRAASEKENRFAPSESED